MAGNAGVYERHVQQCHGERARTLRDARRLAAAGQAEAAHDQLQRAGFWRQLERTWQLRLDQEREDDWQRTYHVRQAAWADYYTLMRGTGGVAQVWTALMNGTRGQEEHGRMAYVHREVERLCGADWKTRWERESQADQLWGDAMMLGRTHHDGVGKLRAHLQTRYAGKGTYGRWPLVHELNDRDLAAVRRWLAAQPHRAPEGDDG